MVTQEMINKWKQRHPHKGPEPLMLIDDSRQIMWMNPAAEKLAGKSNEQVAGCAFCYDVFQCQDECGRLLGDHCPGNLGFAKRLRNADAAYFVVDEAGGKVKVRSQYHFVKLPINGRRISAVRMKPVEVVQNFHKQRIVQAAVAGVALSALVSGSAWWIRRKLARHTTDFRHDRNAGEPAEEQIDESWRPALD